MVTIFGWLLMVTCPLAAGGIIVGVWKGTRLWLFVQPRPQRAAVTCTVIPNRRAAPPPQQLAVSFWEPPRVKGEIER